MSLTVETRTLIVVRCPVCSEWFQAHGARPVADREPGVALFVPTHGPDGSEQACKGSSHLPTAIDLVVQHIRS